jgi:hypothetical protein
MHVHKHRSDKARFRKVRMPFCPLVVQPSYFPFESTRQLLARVFLKPPYLLFKLHKPTSNDLGTGKELYADCGEIFKICVSVDRDVRSFPRSASRLRLRQQSQPRVVGAEARGTQEQLQDARRVPRVTAAMPDTFPSVDLKRREGPGLNRGAYRVK